MSEACDMLDSTPPWLLGKSQSYEDEFTLHDEIQLFCKWISPTREEQMMRESVIVRISCVVCQLWPTAQVKTYGSYATQLYLPNSDVDLCVVGAPPGPQSLVTLAEVLHAKELSTQLHVISSAKVPIIKLTDKVSGSIVDISLNQDVRTNELVSSYMERYPALRPLTLILKLFLFQRRLHESYTGGLSSFSLLIIIVSFLQFHVPDSTNKNGPKVASKSNLGNLLIDFFKFYGKQFDYEHIGISIRDSGCYFPKMSRNWYDPFNPCVFSLESPLDATSDVGRGAFATPRVVAAFAKAYEELTANNTPRLSSVLIVDNTIIERRSHIMSLYTRQTSSPPHTHHRTQRSVSATAAMQTVSPPRLKPSFSIPIPSSSTSSSSSPRSNLPPSIAVSSATNCNTSSSNVESQNPIFLSTSAPPHPLSPPSPPTSHTPIHISPATSPRMLTTAAPQQDVHAHPTISGFDAKELPNTDSSTDTDTDTDADADIDTDSGDHSHNHHLEPSPALSSSSSAPLVVQPSSSVNGKSPFYNCPQHHSMSGLDYYLRTMQSHFQSLHPSLAAPIRPGKKSKNSKRMHKLQQLQQQLAQHVGMVEIDGMGGGDVQNNLHTGVNVNNSGNNNNNTKGSKKEKRNSYNNNNNNNNYINANHCINNTSTPTTISSSALPPPNPPTKSPSCIISDSLPPIPVSTTTATNTTNTTPTITNAITNAITTPKGRRNSNPSRRNSNPQMRRNSNAAQNRRNSNPPTVTPLITSCTTIPEIETPSSNANAKASTPTSTPNTTPRNAAQTQSVAPTTTQSSTQTTIPTNATPTANSTTSTTSTSTSTSTSNGIHSSEFPFKGNNSNNNNNNSNKFRPANPKQQPQQRWAPKVSNSSKKLNLLQSCSVPVSN